MADDLNFNSAEFMKLPIGERIERCRLYAKQAQSLADNATPDFRQAYEEIAKHWLFLADNMARTISN